MVYYLLLSIPQDCVEFGPHLKKNTRRPVPEPMASDVIIKDNQLDNPEFLTGGGEMGQRIREFEWSSTPLGPIEQWPQSLRTCMRIMLTSPQPIWIGWGKELITLYNDPYLAIIGGKHPRALGEPTAVVWREVWPAIGPMLKQVMEKDEGTYVESQLLIMERNGYPEETYYTFSYSPIPGNGGSAAGMICFNTDDTERIISERQLQTLTRLGKRLADPKTDTDIIEKTVATLSENPYDFPFASFYRPDAIDKCSFPLQKALDSRKPEMVEHLQDKMGIIPKGAWEVPPDKALILPIMTSAVKDPYGYLVVGINPYRLANEKYISFFSLVADQMATSFASIHALEEERERAEALAEIDRTKTIFFSNISHEFRTPLTLLLGPIEDVLNNPDAAGIDKYRMGIAHRNALRMQKLVNTLLEFSRIEAGRLEGRFTRVDICSFTRELASSFRSAIEKAGMNLYTSCDTICGEVYVDVDMWEMIVLNLVSNAFKYSRDGHIEVAVHQAGREVQVSVTDTGAGIPEDQLEKIFNRFHRVSNVQGRSQEGTGIGLAMVKELVKLHKGSIAVSSSLGEGSTFTVSLPLGKQHLPADRIINAPQRAATVRHADAFVSEAMKWIPDDAGNAQEEQKDISDHDEHRGNLAPDLVAPSAGKKYKVLLADDNADMRDYVSRLLSEHYDVITAVDGEDAFEKMILRKPDLLLSDVMMPKIDGFSLLKKIRSHPAIQNIPVILLSARAGEEAKLEGLDTGADDYLVKPFSAKELLARVDGSIKLARSRIAQTEILEQEVKHRTRELSLLNISLQRSNEDLQQFAHVASHDLKEPVRKIRTFGSRLQDEYGDILPGRARLFLDKIHNATERMFSMIDGVLAYSMLNASEQPIEQVDLNDILKNIESDLEIFIQQKKAVVKKGRFPTIEGASVLIHQLFYNLLNNSLKFSQTDVPPVIHINSEIVGTADAQMAKIGFTDNGIGFDQQHAISIFDTFARLNSKDKYEGTGLGLSLCKKIVERHHGTITAMGTKNKGAVFIIQLPLKQTEKTI
jgi:signal transduction histidine kinase